MKLKVLKCPECRANLEIEEGRTSCFCQYCGCKIILDDEKQEHTINKNININKNTSHTETYVDQAEIVKSNNEDKSEKRSLLVGLLCGFGIPIAMILAIVLYFAINSGVAQSQGKINAGNCSDLVGQNYESVVAHFEAAGFTNIQVIDLNDSGLAFWNDEKVATISVGGDTDFDSTDWFDPDTKVVISYH